MAKVRDLTKGNIGKEFHWSQQSSDYLPSGLLWRNVGGIRRRGVPDLWCQR